MIENKERLDALVRYAARKGRPLSFREYLYVRRYIRWRRFDRMMHGWFFLAVGFSAIILGGLASTVTPFGLVLALGGVALNLLAAETLDPKERTLPRQVPVRRSEHPHLREHRVRMAELERIGA